MTARFSPTAGISSLRERLMRPPTAVCFIFFLLYLLYAFEVHPPWKYLASDMGGFIERARNLAEGKELAPYDSFYPVGTTYLLAPFFFFLSYDTALSVITVLWCALIALSNLLVFYFSRYLGASKTSAMAAMLLACCFYPFFCYVGLYLSEAPFFFFLLAATFAYCRILNDSSAGLTMSFLSGALMGFALIIKGTLFVGLSFLLALLFWEKIKKRKPGQALLYLVGVLAIYGVQVIHISQALGELQCLPTNGSLAAYLGQKHLKSVKNIGHYDYFFRNNNFWFDSSLRDHETLGFDVYEAPKFNALILDLWEADPWKQIEISLNSGVDLFRITNNWPVLGMDAFWENLDIYSQWAWILLVWAPLLATGMLLLWERLTPFRCGFSPRYKSGFLAAALLLLGLVLTAMSSKGEPRYLVPWGYLALPLLRFDGGWRTLLQTMRGTSGSGREEARSE